MERIFNTGETESQLREQYNPEQSTMRKAQLRMLDILKFISDICDRNNIRYWLAGGTLLGAYRHRGFIPWDDDLDIEMPREDYLRFRDIMLSLDNPQYVLQDYSTDANYYFAYTKIRDTHSFCQPNGEDGEKLWKYRGIWVDIFILEDYDVSWQICSFYTYTYGRRFLCNSNNFLLKVLAKMRWFINYKIIFPPLRLLAKGLSSGKTMSKTLGSEYPAQYNREDVFPLKKIIFEDSEFWAPCHPENILDTLYSFDFRKLPPKEDREGHKMSISFDC